MERYSEVKKFWTWRADLRKGADVLFEDKETLFRFQSYMLREDDICLEVYRVGVRYAVALPLRVGV